MFCKISAQVETFCLESYLKDDTEQFKVILVYPFQFKYWLFDLSVVCIDIKM